MQDPHKPREGQEQGVDFSDGAKTETVTGLKFIFLLFSLTLACFLILLDASIVSTVRYVDETVLKFRKTYSVA